MRYSALTFQFRCMFIGISALVALYAVFIRQYETITSLQAAYATLIVMLGALPAVVAWLDKREADLIPLMPLHGIFYALTFGLPVFSDKTLWLGEQDAMTASLVLTVLGLICLYLGYYAFRGFFRRLKPVRSRNVPMNQQIWAAWILFAVYLSFHFIPVLRDVPSFEQLRTPLSYLPLGILALLVFGHRLHRIHLFLFVAAVVVTMLIAILSGSLAPPVFFLIFLSILYWNKKRRIPWHFIALGGLIAILLNPVKSQYRGYIWFSEEASISYYDRAILLSNVVQEYYSDATVFAKVSEDTSTVNRLAHISTFSRVIATTPGSVPYWLGDSYHTLWTSFIPRILWPGKPEATIGQDFGHRYSLLAPENVITSMNLPWLVEFYANFGASGVLVGMFFVGIFFRILVQKLRIPVSSTIEHVLSVTIVFSLFYAESNFSLMVGGILPIYISLIVLLRLLTSRYVFTSSNYVRGTPKTSI